MKLCECGCGQPTSIFRRDTPSRGQVKGEARRFVRGHRIIPRQEERFWACVAKADGCWTWTGTTSANGYGVMQWNGRQAKAHRVAVLLDGREIPEGAFVCHHCDNPSCVRPDHLYVGTAVDNNRDTVARGRRHARRAQCRKGHPLSGENAVIAYGREGIINGVRCRICRNAANAASLRRAYERRKSA